MIFLGVVGAGGLLLLGFTSSDNFLTWFFGGVATFGRLRHDTSKNQTKKDRKHYFTKTGVFS